MQAWNARHSNQTADDIKKHDRTFDRKLTQRDGNETSDANPIELI